VFLWPSTSCDPGGYYTLVTADGRFVGNVAAGTQLRAIVPSGEYTLLGWNASREEAQGPTNKGSVPVLHARLLEGRTYYVRMVFGEWDDRGPVEVFGSRSAMPLCMAPDHNMSSAMVKLTPASALWKELPTWTADLEAVVPDNAQGQAWLNNNRDVVGSHRELAEGRFEGFRPVARRMATIEADDGVPTSR
jgi:hypothetical protein